MKARILRLGATILLLLFSSCMTNKDTTTLSPTTGISDMTWDIVDPHATFSELTLPENCQNMLPDQLYYPKIATSYDVGFERDRTKVISALMGDSPELLSEGIYKKNSNTLNYQYNTTLSFRNDDIMPILESAFPVTAQAGDVENKLIMGISKNNYGSEDLDWMSMDNAIKQVQEFLFSIEVLNPELYLAKTLHPDIVRRTLHNVMNYAQNEEPMREIERIQELLQRAEKYEEGAYFFCFRMCLDGIPVITAPNVQNEQGINGVEIYCIYGIDGFELLKLVRVPSSVTAKDTKNIISPQLAAEILVRCLPVTNDPPVIRIEEFYIAYTYHNHEDALRPTWILVTSQPWWRDETIRTYNYYAIDAISGEQIFHGKP